MKKFKNVLLALALGSFAFGLAACNSNTPANPDNNSGNNDKPSGGDDKPSGGNTDTPSGGETDTEAYKVQIKTIGGRPLSAVPVTVSASGTTKTVTTDTKGYAYFEGLADATYRVSVNLEDQKGFKLKNEDEIVVINPSAKSAVVEVVNYLITDETKPAGYVYSVGESLYDFTISDVFGQTYTISDILEEKDCVVLNFWYTTCSWCIREFPYLESAYQALSNDVEVIAINPGALIEQNDSVSDVTAFMSQYGLSFPCAMDIQNVDESLAKAFGTSAFPTSVFIDRYGMIARIEEGAITSESKWKGAINQYLGDDYTPIYEGADAGDVIKPTEKFPGNDAIKNAIASSDLVATFSDETGNDAEYNWPWVLAGENGIKASNQKVNSSYAIFHMNVTIPKDKVLVMDYRASSESDDYLYVMCNNRSIAKISGLDADWQSAFLYVASKDTTLDISFCYFKDEGSYEGDDTVYIKGFKYIDISSVTTPTYAIRDCAMGDVNPITGIYDDYEEVFLNETDGYYHVGSVNGPLVLANLLDGYTKFSQTSIYSYAYDNCVIFDDIDYTYLITLYSNYASNSTIAYMGLPTSGLVPVTEELYNALVRITSELGSTIGDNPNQWLEVCVYIEQYGTGGKDLIGDPIKGLATFSAYEAKLGDNSVTFDRPIVPRGLMTKFVPSKAGVYKVYAKCEEAADCFIYDADGKLVKTLDSFTTELREFYKLETAFYTSGYQTPKAPEFTTYLYLEQGVACYVCPAYNDLYEWSELKFAIEYVGEEMDVLTVCSYAPFSTSNDDMTGDIIATANISVALGEDGYYHPVVNGVIQTNDFIYADFAYFTGPFTDANLAAAIELGAFDFTKDEDGNPVNYDDAEDFTNLALAYYNKRVTDETSELYGTVKVDEGLAMLLQLLCEKYLFEGVQNSWLKLCYYYNHLGK